LDALRREQLLESSKAAGRATGQDAGKLISVNEDDGRLRGGQCGSREKE
jgi:hypothetical protein